ncbi:PIN domain-containing protein [Luteolibacter arcticus]|uniref:Ribonuclease VapC n=1 Tax=Luteolibacter arcticus TaxID=1581411 RepID=A0ABT3GHL8_9BACT|nr:TA system VapC family ribonuclease toxin [Luteolibacter arcticus]MCW1922863.1 PIN domain-containing protein [Luteolibacter arcticus]
MPGLIDTNVLLYAANSSCGEHPAARDFLTAAATSADRWYLTDAILYEFLRVATHPKVFPRPLTWREAFDFLRPLIACEAFTILESGPRHWELLEKELPALAHPSGNLFFDIRTTVMMRERGIRTIYTRDKDFLQFRGIEVVDPFSPP